MEAFCVAGGNVASAYVCPFLQISANMFLDVFKNHKAHCGYLKTLIQEKLIRMLSKLLLFLCAKSTNI